MKIEGACHCGEIKYEAEVSAEKVMVCHCADCQTFSGSAFRVIVWVDESNIKFPSGKPFEYVKIAESGNKRAQGFCRNCGTGLYATSADEKRSRVYGLRVGTTRQRDQLVPKRQIWLRSRQRWLSNLDSLPGTEKQQ
ncbi:MAG: GFA family protein [Hyphomicrobium sp.]|nr:GFA family protein [Hyphomicrobium sp.]